MYNLITVFIIDNTITSDLVLKEQMLVETYCLYIN